jgi:hypothetical protein
MALKKLEYVNLYENPLTDGSLTALQKMPALKAINLWQTQISDKGIAALKSDARQLVVNH